MEYVIGIDGGGTKTRLSLCTLDKQVLSTSVAGPSNILSSGIDITRQSIEQVVSQGVIDQGYDLQDCRALCIGVAGGARDVVRDNIADIIKGLGYFGKTIVTHDAQTALVAGTDGNEGILLIAGTGSICYGINQSGRTCRVGGWGHLIDDEGSAYYISTHILNTIMRAYDGRSEATLLTQLVLKYMELENVEDIISAIYKPMMSKHQIAELSVLVERACELDDAAALDIVRVVVDVLYKHVETAISELGLEDKPIPLIINGSVIINNKYINKGFVEQIKKSFPLATVCPLSKDASYGAALIALKG